MKTLVVASKNIEHRVLLDDEDFENVTKHRWFINKGYAQRACWDGKNYVNLSMHRFVMQEPEGKVIDHIDGNPLNNQKKTLAFTNWYFKTVWKISGATSSEQQAYLAWSVRHFRGSTI